jgi:UDP-galactopyranose mutase
MDLDLVARIAALRPDWQFIFLGPVVKIMPTSLPVMANIHFLGAKSYYVLPEYIANWDVALLPFARSQATRYISPTKVPEYLAAGKPVVSTSITDVINDYGQAGLVSIADRPEDFVAAAEHLIQEQDSSWLPAVDQRLRAMSWDTTWCEMHRIIQDYVNESAAEDYSADSITLLESAGS